MGHKPGSLSLFQSPFVHSRFARLVLACLLSSSLSTPAAYAFIESSTLRPEPTAIDNIPDGPMARQLLERRLAIDHAYSPQVLQQPSIVLVPLADLGEDGTVRYDAILQDRWAKVRRFAQQQGITEAEAAELAPGKLVLYVPAGSPEKAHATVARASDGVRQVSQKRFRDPTTLPTLEDAFAAVVWGNDVQAQLRRAGLEARTIAFFAQVPKFAGTGGVILPSQYEPIPGTAWREGCPLTLRPTDANPLVPTADAVFQGFDSAGHPLYSGGLPEDSSGLGAAGSGHAPGSGLDIAIGSGHGGLMRRPEHEERFNQSIALVLQRLGADLKLPRLGGSGQPVYDFRAAVLQQGKRVDTAAGVAVRLERKGEWGQESLELEPDGLLVIRSPQFPFGHAGRDAFTVYGPDEATCAHEAAELRAWAAFAVAMRLISWKDIHTSGRLGETLQDWFSKLRESSSLPSHTARMLMDLSAFFHLRGVMAQVTVMMSSQDTLPLLVPTTYMTDPVGGGRGRSNDVV